MYQPSKPWQQNKWVNFPKCQAIGLDCYFSCMAGLSILHCVNRAIVCQATIWKSKLTQHLKWHLENDICKTSMSAFRYQFAKHYTNIIKYIYISYEAYAFIFTLGILQTRQVRFPVIVFGQTDSSYCTYCMSTCWCASVKSWQLKRKNGCEMASGYIPPVLHSLLYKFKV